MLFADTGNRLWMKDIYHCLGFVFFFSAQFGQFSTLFFANTWYFSNNFFLCFTSWEFFNLSFTCDCECGFWIVKWKEILVYTIRYRNTYTHNLIKMKTWFIAQHFCTPFYFVIHQPFLFIVWFHSFRFLFRKIKSFTVFIFFTSHAYELSVIN